MEDLLPVHPTTGLIALGLRADGRPIWPILGAADDDSGDGDDGGDDAGDDDSGDDDAGDGNDDDSGKDDDKPLGEKGTRALQAEKQKRREAQAALREWKKLGASAADVAKLLEGATGKDGEPDPEKVRRDAEQAATEKVNIKLKRHAVVAAAAGKLADPRDAARMLDLDKIDLDDDGELDEDEVADLIDDLLKKKPYLSAQGGKRFQGSGDGGARNGDRKSQLTREELKKLSPAERMKAFNEGRAKNLTG